MKPRKPVILDPETGVYRVTLTREQFALIDPEDAEFISQWDWNASGHGYAVRTDRVGEQRYVRMHRALAERWGWNIAGLQIDHVNGNGFDNRRANLRPATASENSRNRGPQRNNTSGFKGVSWNKRQSRWESKIWTHGRCVHLGRFDRRGDAASAYSAAVEKHHGEFARIEPRRDVYGSRS